MSQNNDPKKDPKGDSDTETTIDLSDRQHAALKTALAAAENPIMLDSSAQVGRAAKAWKRSTLLAVDTEFVRERTYFANLGLVQISDGHTVWLLDPLIDGALEPLEELLANPAITKLLHSPSEDLDVLKHVTGALPEPMIDSQLACAMLGQPLQLGYHKAAEWLLGITVDKELTRSNWMARPFRPELLHYAALDVCILPLMWERLQQQLSALGREPWLSEDCERMLSGARTPNRPEDAWQRVKGMGRLDGVSLAILQAHAAWRDEEARQRNRPKGFIINDAILMQLAQEKMTHSDALSSIEDLHPRARARYADTLTGLAKQAMDQGRSLQAPQQAGIGERALLKRMRSLVAEKAGELSVEPTLLASKRDMEHILFADDANPLPDRLSGWRKDIVGEPLVDLARQG